MPACYLIVKRQTPMLLSPNLSDWVPTLAGIAPEARPVNGIVIDSGFCGEAAIEMMIG